MSLRSLLRFVPLVAAAPSAHGQEQWTVATDDTSLTVSAEGDRVELTSLTSGTGSSDWIGAPILLPLPDHVFVADVSRPVRWRYSGAVQDRAGGATTLRWECGDPRLELLSIWQAQAGAGPVEHHFEIVNRSGGGIEVPLMPSLALTVTAPAGHVLENWWVEKGNGEPSDAGTHQEKIGDGYRFHGRATPYAEAPEMIPWVSIQDTTGDAGVYCGIEFSGRVGIDLGASREPLQVTIAAGLDPSERDFRSRVADGDRFVTPTVFVGCYRGDVDDGANRLHQFVATRLRPPVSDARCPLIVNNSWGSGMAVDEALARRMIDDSAALGVELFHIDAGWFRAVGDWHPDPVKFPKGLAPLSDYVHGKGMLFGLWVGWTQGGTESRGMETLSVTNPAQRGWFTHDYPASWKPSDFTGATVCLGSERARAWCLDELRRLVTSCRLDLLEHDQTMIVDRCDRTDHGHTANPADVACHAARGYYAVYDRLAAEHPRLLFEDCVNGGRTVDFGIVRRTHYISITDSYDPMSNRRAFYDASYPMPPAMCECYVENDPGPSLATFKSMLRSGMMGWCTIMCDTKAWSAEQHAVAKREIEIYKEWIRPLINHGDLHHVSARPADGRWDGMQYIDPSTGHGVAFVFRGSAAVEATHRFKWKGLDRAVTYEVWSEDGSVPRGKATGSVLMDDGTKVELVEAGTSDLIRFRAEAGTSTGEPRKN